MERGSSRCGGSSGGIRASLAALLVLAALMLLAACGGGGGEASGGSGEAEQPEEDTAGVASTPEETTPEEMALTPAGATVSDDEETAMPADGKAEDPDQPPPENPPEGVQTYPATTNRNVSGTVEYEQSPPTNGDHAPYWLNCGYYSSPVENEAAVHSLDHGTVWLTYLPDLPQDQVDTLRQLAGQEYVIVSPYPDQSAPVVATAWRNQLELTGADDPRLQQFVDQFRVSSTAPRSGNGCSGGSGEPEA